MSETSTTVGNPIPENSIILDLPEDKSIILEYNEIVAKPHSLKSVSRITPVNEDVLIIQYGVVEMMALLTAISQGKHIGGQGYYMIGGVGNSVPEFFELGMKVALKMEDDMQLRHIEDPANAYSFDKIRRRAKEDKNLFAAVTIATNKERSKVGLALDSKVAENDLIQEKAHQFDKNKSMGNMLFKGEFVPFVNYKLCHYSNIGAVIYDK